MNGQQQAHPGSAQAKDAVEKKALALEQATAELKRPAEIWSEPGSTLTFDSRCTNIVRSSTWTMMSSQAEAESGDESKS